MSVLAYTFSDYREFLRQRIALEPRNQGVKQRLAEAMRIQPAYLSQVLKNERHLSVEQLIPSVEFFGLPQDEGEYLVCLLDHNRCSNPASRQFLERTLADRRARFAEIQTRVKIKNELSEKDKATYYSSFIYGAVHMAVTVPRLRSVRAIARHLSQPEERVRAAVNFLTEAGLVVAGKAGLGPGTIQMFVPKNSPFVLANHRNWRERALTSAELRREEDYHFTAAFSVSKEDAEILRLQIAKLTEEMVSRIKDSPEEELKAICLDFFSV
jgi:uncharacterized protein (TIGR02147 family)